MRQKIPAHRVPKADKKIKIKAKEWLGTRELTHKRIKTNNE